MKVLVTGASGFIGRALVRRLAAGGAGLRAAVRAPDSGRVLADSVERLVVGEIGPATDWTAALAGCTHVVHLAGRAHVFGGGDATERFQAVNTIGTLRVAEAAAESGVRRFVFVSSIGVLGRASAAPVTESDREAPHDQYAQAKLAAEQGLARLAERSALEIVIVRPPLVHGPGAPGNLARLAALVQQGWPLPFGSIDNRRTLVSVDNLVELLELCLTHPAAGGQVFVAGDAEAVSTADIVRFLAEGMQRPARLVRFPPAVLRTLARAAGRWALYERLCGDLSVDASKARKLLGWIPRVSTADGLRATGRAAVS